MTGRRKIFQEPHPPALLEETTQAKLAFPLPSAAMCSIDLSGWLGKGLDAWVLNCTGQLKAFVDNKTVSPASVVAYGKALKYFFEFLRTSGAPAAPEQLLRRDLELFVTWLKQQSRFGDVSRRNVFTHTKSVLVAMLERGVLADHENLFPCNPFSDAARKAKGSASFSPAERSRMADALRRDIIDLHAGRFTGTDAQGLVVYALALAMRTGLNTTPLLELERDCLRPHPFMPRMRLLRAYKRRGNATHVKALRYQRTLEVPASVPMDGVALFEEVLRRTQPLAVLASAQLKDKVWLYVSEAMVNLGTVCCLDGCSFGYNVSRFVQRHALRADDGTLLLVNTSRLRKTMENRLWRLSNGDLFTVAAIMGHTPSVAEHSYLAVTDDMRRNAAFVGEALPVTYRSAGQLDIRPQLEATPVGNCQDSLHGHRAPGNGTHCTDFLSCFGCRSFAIVGTHEDLHRLFSFYWFLAAEGRAAQSRDWAEHFLQVRTQIDTFTLDKFDETLVEAAKEAARTRPLKFWSLHKRAGGALHVPR